MKKFLSAAGSAALLLCLLFSLGCATSGCPEKLCNVHFFVVPKTLPDNTPAEEKIQALRLWLSETAGGYTEVPTVPGGWINESGHLETADQFGFFVTSEQNLQDALVEYIKAHFQERQPYVVVWRGESSL